MSVTAVPLNANSTSGIVATAEMSETALPLM
jgi:hypothetical protein